MRWFFRFFGGLAAAVPREGPLGALEFVGGGPIELVGPGNLTYFNA
jgi:hypothetical protein